MKITQEQADEANKLHKEGLSWKELGKRYGVSSATIWSNCTFGISGHYGCPYIRERPKEVKTLVSKAIRLHDTEKMTWIDIAARMKISPEKLYKWRKVYKELTENQKSTNK